jgi:signal transduction histidine kinase
MIRILTTYLLLAGLLPALTAAEKPQKWSITQLEQRRAEIDRKLNKLPRYSLRSGIGAIGYRSFEHTTADAKEWVEIDLGSEFPIHSVILAPNLSRNSEQGYQSDGFPRAFRVIAYTDLAPDGTLIAEYSTRAQSQPRIAPLIIPIKDATASRIRIEATQLSTRTFDNQYVFQLAEVLIFSGTENVALRRPVRSSSSTRDQSGAWDQRFLVDGCMTYLMHSAKGNGSVAYVSQRYQRPDLTIDLGTSQPISRIQLHAVEQSDTVPQAYAGDLGIPKHLKITGANLADFSDAVTLLDHRQNSINESGPILIWNVPETSCRYVRLSATDSANRNDRIGFAEIELFANGKNVALGRPAYIDPKYGKPFRPLNTLTDGKNRYGKILPIHTWLKQLALRHELETQRPRIEAELDRLYARQKSHLRRVSWLAALLIAAIAIAIPIERNIHLRKLNRIKSRFAADLHDELGANLHTIGLLSDLADESRDDPGELSEYLHRIRTVTERSGTAVRYVTSMHESDELFTGLRVDMKRAAERIVAQLEHEIVIEGEEHLARLPLRTRTDLFLFYKECLINICRHSGATQLSSHLHVSPKEIRMTITDNGRGLAESTHNEIPKSLKRRAQLLGAKITLERPAKGGTCIILKLRPRRSLIRPNAAPRNSKGV